MSNKRASEYQPPPEWFDRWWEPKEFFTVVREHNQQVPEVDFFERAELQPLREAYAAGLFATILAEEHAVSLRLQRERFPDFDLRIDDQVLPFELVEADRPGRRRGDEYRGAARREAAGFPPKIEEFDPQLEEKAAIPAIKRAIAEKAAKRYKPAPYLLVYVNFWLFDQPPLTTDQFAGLVSRWRDQFPEIWLLWGAKAIRCWPNPVRLAARSLPDLL